MNLSKCAVCGADDASKNVGLGDRVFCVECFKKQLDEMKPIVEKLREVLITKGE